MRFCSFLIGIGAASAAFNDTWVDDLHATCTIGYCTQNGGTSGGSGGAVVNVTTLEQLKAAAGSNNRTIIIITANITGSSGVSVKSNKTILGAARTYLEGVGFKIDKQSNVILRNLKISKVIAGNGDAITVQKSTNVWIDHCDISSDMTHGKDYYDGLLDINHGSDWATVSNTYLHDHYKGSLIGHSDSNGAEDKGKLHVTYANNYWKNVNSRCPSLRFGTGHIFNSYYAGVGSGINTRMGAQVLVQSTVFEKAGSDAIMSKDSPEKGFAVVQDVNLGGSRGTAPQGTLTAVPYNYTLLGSANVKGNVTVQAGQTLNFYFDGTSAYR